MPIHQSSLFGIDIGQDDVKTVQTETLTISSTIRFFYIQKKELNVITFGQIKSENIYFSEWVLKI